MIVDDFAWRGANGRFLYFILYRRMLVDYRGKLLLFVRACAAGKMQAGGAGNARN